MLRIAACADNGHDVLNFGDDAWFPAARLPLRMVWFPDGWVIARADAAHADLVGARVLRLEHQSSDQVFRRARTLFGGTDAYRRWNAEPWLENAGLLQALGVAAHPDGVTLELSLADGSHTMRRVSFERRDGLPGGQAVQRIWTPAPWPGEAERGWKVLNPQPTPLYLQEGEKSFRLVALPQLGALYLQLRSHFDADDETLAAFEQRVDAAIEREHPRHLIVDLRFDTGGNTDLTREWQRSLPARIPGRIYVLVGPYTFSAGIVAAAAFRHDLGGRARLVGDEVGDRSHWWSEGHDVCATNSKYCLHLTTGLWDLVHGCAGKPGCYGDKYDARVPGLRPDVYAPLTAAAFLAGKDPGMATVERELGSAVRATEVPGGAPH
ncbi:MAG: hypothetical protein JOZ67_11155 [Gammaproteobacteria bacterium]|nr:hypothetical protein [Gammaproteobacteria bacterium]